MRPLPDLDLARLGPLPREHKLFELRRMKAFRAPYRLFPVRQNSPDILNIQTPFGAGPRTPWKIIQENIIRLGKSPEEDNANVQVGEALYQFADEHQIIGRQRDDLFPLLIGASQRLAYWFNAILVIDAQPTLAFIDPRTGARLDEDGRRFVFSMQQERIRAYPDFKNVRLGIIQMRPLGKSSARIAHLFTSEGVILFTFEELDAMIRETYELWRLVLEEREEERKRSSGGKMGPLGI
jgi:hypothetical protein